MVLLKQNICQWFWLFLPELQVSLYSVAPTIGLHSTSMDELVYDVTLKFDTYPRGAGE